MPWWGNPSLPSQNSIQKLKSSKRDIWNGHVSWMKSDTCDWMESLGCSLLIGSGLHFLIWICWFWWRPPVQCELGILSLLTSNRLWAKQQITLTECNSPKGMTEALDLGLRCGVRLHSKIKHTQMSTSRAIHTRQQLHIFLQITGMGRVKHEWL